MDPEIARAFRRHAGQFNYAKKMALFVQSCLHDYQADKFKGQGKLAVDIGACLGGFIGAFFDQFEKFLCFEPIEANCGQLKTYFHFAMAEKEGPGRPQGKVELFSLAAWSPPSNKVLQQFWHSGGDCPGHYSAHKHKGAAMATGNFADTIAFPDMLQLCKERGYEEIDYLKLDCEGAEYQFLMDQDLSDVRVIGMELHKEILGQGLAHELTSWIDRTHKLQVVLPGTSPKMIWQRLDLCDGQG